MSNVLFTLLGRIAIDASSAQSTIDNTMTSVKGLADELGATSDAADETGKSVGSGSKLSAGTIWLGNMLTKLTNVMGKAALSIGKTGFEYNAMMESYQTAFGVLLGDGEKAKQMLDDLWTLAADTPMEMTGLAANAQELLNFGVAAEEIIPTLKMLGDASMGNQTKLDRLVLAYGQVKEYGGLRAQETMQFIENGFPIMEMLEAVMGKSHAELLGLREDGGILFSDVQAAIQYATSESGRYFESMDKYAQTNEGQKAKIRDTWAQTIGNLLKPMFDESSSTILPAVSSSLEKFGTWVSENQEAITSFSQAVSDLVVNGLHGLTASLEWIISNSTAVGTGLTTIATGLAAGAIVAHPYLSLLTGIVGAMTWLSAEGAKANAEKEAKLNGMKYQSFQEWAASDEAMPMEYTDDQLKNLERYANVCKQIEQMEGVEYDASTVGGILGQQQLDGLKKEREQLIELLDPSYGAWYKGTIFDAGGGIISEYDKWSSKLNELGYIDESYPGYIFEAPYELPLAVSPDAEATVQNDINGMALEAIVALTPDLSQLYSIYGFVSGGGEEADGSHASGLDYVPKDGYMARLHLGEAVLPRHEADAYRKGGSSMDIGRLESAINSLSDRVYGIMQQVAMNTAGNQIVCLETGAIVGQTARQMDAELGNIATRKGRRN